MRATFFKYCSLFPNLILFLKGSKQSNPLGNQGKVIHYTVGSIPCILGYGNCDTNIMSFISSFSVDDAFSDNWIAPV